MNKQVPLCVISSRAINARDSHNKNKTIRQPAILICYFLRVSASMKFKEAIAYGASKLQYESLKEGQIKTVEGYLSGQDVFVCSPTGSGSLCFEIAPCAIDWVKFGPPEEENIVRTVCVIVAPLLSLMHDQVASPKRIGIAAICIRPECSQEDIKKTATYRLLHGS